MWGRFENDQRVNNYQNPMICNCNLIWLSSLPRSSQCSLSFKFPHQNRVCISFLSIYATFSVHLIQITFGEEHKSWSSSLCSFLQSPVSSTLVGPKYLLQYSTLKRLQLMFFPQCEKPSYKPIQNNMQNHSSVQSLQTDRQQMGRQEIMSQMAADIP